MTEIEVEIAWALPGHCESLKLILPAEATVAEALLRAAGAGFEPAAAASADRLAIFGRLVHPGTLLRGGERIELLRPLQADPKQRRRDRAGGRR